MSILSLYSKIQLKIGKCEEELNSVVIPKRSEESKSVADTAGGKNTKGADNHALRSLSRYRSFGMTKMAIWKAAKKCFLKFQLLFWKTLKTIIRFFALLFNDSSENFLMFASEYKAKRLHSPKGIMEPAFTFVCNNSFCQYKRFQKRVRFYSKTAFAGILVCTVITSGVLYFMMPGKYDIKAATHSWNQSNWITGADITAVATHTLNQTGWTKFYSKDDNVNVGTTGEIKLTSTTSTIVETSDADFDEWTQSTDLAASGDFYVNNDNLYMKKADGGSCTADGECVGGFCFGGACFSNDMIVIGTQTWMKYNLNVGTMLASGGTTPNTGDTNIEKWCYNNDPNICNTDGGLYSWDEAMSVGSGAQGICPTGTHIPTDAEYKTLVEYLATPGCESSTGWQCSPAGTALKVGGSSGFAGLLTGYRRADSSFHGRGVYTSLWSSSEGTTGAWKRNLYSSETGVHRYGHDKAFGFSVRCLRD